MDKGMKLEEPRVVNVIGSTPSSKGAQDEYYAYMIRQEKLRNAVRRGQLGTKEAASISSISDLDQLELKALARLHDLSDNSPELLQYFAITHCSTREDVAKKLAKKQLRKQLVEEAVNKVLSPESVKKAVDSTLSATRTNRSKNGFGLGEVSWSGEKKEWVSGDRD
jgi:ATP-dependent protease HslVU (ClpYQ) ATPase subunit